MGADMRQGQRQGAKQDLIKSIEKFLGQYYMKSVKEILEMLLEELIMYLEKSEHFDTLLMYQNKKLGDTSFLLAALLESLLKQYHIDWDEKKWIDDSLITRVTTKNDILTFEGVMIWGIIDSTEQWTDPFVFNIEILKDKKIYSDFTFLFCDMIKSEIKYEDFINNRDYWTSEIGYWKYIINSKSGSVKQTV
ncbi:hypothetical protein [Sphingobacterium sp. UDSM-2020]|uniref:hypothetical protein n=1 Tax=Sphingobacterium sp. UDSM-2020 TaxID=2795738 RepID=UPI0019376ABD|nr:hypothetical protein [Sphingobacterium sp. UDSM-2020]QQD13971.1 hypothetical protein JAZ75_00035 [Sphingobacterium sp. UDSM-2020]